MNNIGGTKENQDCLKSRCSLFVIQQKKKKKKKINVIVGGFKSKNKNTFPFTRATLQHDEIHDAVM